MDEKKEAKQDGKSEEYWLEMETPSERRARLRSLYIVHLAMLIFSLGYSIVLTGLPS